VRASREQMQQEALSRAASGSSLTNWPAIIHGFMAKGIPEADIRPRENIFTYHAWRALGRQVRRGEHGVKRASVAFRYEKIWALQVGGGAHLNQKGAESKARTGKLIVQPNRPTPMVILGFPSGCNRTLSRCCCSERWRAWRSH
jgi:hypothetical protein